MASLNQFSDQMKSVDVVSGFHMVSLHKKVWSTAKLSLLFSFKCNLITNNLENPKSVPTEQTGIRSNDKPDSK